jgi:hypothetical protein
MAGPSSFNWNRRWGWAAALFAGLLGLVGNAAAQTSLFLTDAPVWAHYFCDSSEPDPKGSTSLQGTHCYPSLTVPSGATLTVTNLLSGSGAPADSPRGALLALVNGPCTIAGTIAASASNTGYSNGGGSGGGGGGSSTQVGAAGLRSMVFGNLSFLTVAAGGTAGSKSGSGGAGASPTAASQQWVWNVGAAFGVLGGSSGGTGGVGSGGAAVGGKGGGGVALVCSTISFTGAVRVNGGTGAAGASSGGGGGGGGGGVVLMAAHSYSSNSGTISVGGGAGGTGAGAGGSGGAGWFKQFTLQ